MPLNSKPLFIVAESERKIWDGVPAAGAQAAAAAFVSQYFASNLAFAKQFGSEVRICTGKYGLVKLDFIIPESYSERVIRVGERLSVEKLVEQIRDQRLYVFKEILGLGGHKFAHYLAEAFREFPAVKLRFPFSGMPIGEQQKAVSHALWSGRFFLDGKE